MKTAAKTCPMCGKPRVAEFDPFCSRHCADLDLYRWLKGSYVILGVEEDEREEEPPTYLPPENRRE